MNATNEIQTIREFLSLPKTAMPSALWIDSMGEEGSAWTHLRDYIKPESRQKINHMGEIVFLKADCDEWREGITVTLE